MNPQAEGLTYPDVAFVVDPGRVAAFREVFGFAAGVPPTFLTAAEFAVLPQVVADPRLAVDYSRVVHGSQGYAFDRPVREGERLTVRARLESVKVRAGSGFLTIVMDVIDEAGARVGVCRSTMIERAEA